MTTMTGMELELDIAAVKQAADRLRATNHKLRAEILRLIHSRGKMKVTDIYGELKLEQSVAFQHLAILRKANLVNTRREGKFIYYFVDYKNLETIHFFAKSLLSQEGKQE